MFEKNKTFGGIHGYLAQELNKYEWNVVLGL